jgi:outer membrane protein assembly factor BamA
MKFFYSLIMALMTLFHAEVWLNSAGLGEEDLSKKKEGWYPTGLPIVNYSSDDGIGYGARAYLYYNGSRDDMYFGSAPYFLQVYAQYFATTNGVQYHELNVDMPYIASTRFRLMCDFIYNRELNANYFGLGSNTTKNRLTDRAGRTYAAYNDYADAFLKQGDYPDFKYNNYSFTRPMFIVNLYRDITDDLKIMAGSQIQKIGVESWYNRAFEYGNGKYRAANPTLLDIERPEGYSGGWTNTARLKIRYDERDYIPDPKKGFLLDYCLEVSGAFLGSDYSYLKNAADARFFFNPLKPLVIAFRINYMDSSGGIPFYEMCFFPNADLRQDGLGGNRTLRGYKKTRFVGKTMTLSDLELRLQFYELAVSGQRFVFKLVGFADAGNVYDRAGDPISDPRFGDYKMSYGGGMLIIWNLATVIHLYYGVSSEDSALFVNFEHNF